MSEHRSKTGLIRSKSDPLRAEFVSLDEYVRLCAALESVVMPKLLEAATLLATNRFQIVKLDCRESTAGLKVQSRRAPVDSRLNFEIHRNPGPPPYDKPVFWMYVVCRDNCMENSVPGRLPDLDDESAVQAVVDTFTAACLDATGKTRANSQEAAAGGGPEDNQHKRSLQAASADPDE